MIAMLTKRALVLAEHGRFFSLDEFFDEPCFAAGTAGGWKLAYPQRNATEAEREAQRARTPTFFPRGKSAHDDYIAARLNATVLDIEKWSPFKEALSNSDLNALFPQDVIALHHLYWYDVAPLLSTNPHYRSELEQCVARAPPRCRWHCDSRCRPPRAVLRTRLSSPRAHLAPPPLPLRPRSTTLRLCFLSRTPLLIQVLARTGAAGCLLSTTL